MQFDGPLDLNNHDLTITGTQGIILNGDIGGFGSITKTGDAFVSLEGNNTYAGTTTINNGILVTVDGAGLGAGGTDNKTVVNNGGTLFLAAVGKSIAESLSLAGDGFDGDGALSVAGSGNVITSDMFLASGTTISVPGADTTLTITGPVTSAGMLKKIGAGTLRLDASAAFINVVGGVLELNGTADGTFINYGTTLAGIGTAFGTTQLSDGSFASPGARSGNGIGTLAVQDLNWLAGAQLRFQLGRSAALSDQMIVSASLTHSGSGSYAFAFSDASTPPVPGVTYTLITFADQAFAESDFSFGYAGIPAPGQGTGMVGAFKLTPTQLQFTPSLVVSDLLFRDSFD
jgi:autotransporter-associated beta strand protein